MSDLVTQTVLLTVQTSDCITQSGKNHYYQPAQVVADEFGWRGHTHAAIAVGEPGDPSGLSALIGSPRERCAECHGSDPGEMPHDGAKERPDQGMHHNHPDLPHH